MGIFIQIGDLTIDFVAITNIRLGDNRIPGELREGTFSMSRMRERDAIFRLSQSSPLNSSRSRRMTRKCPCRICGIDEHQHFWPHGNRPYREGCIEFYCVMRDLRAMQTSPEIVPHGNTCSREH